MNYNPIKGMRWSARKPTDARIVISYWEFSKYFMKCHHCGYELPIGSNIFAPRKCPRCDCLMQERRKSK